MRNGTFKFLLLYSGRWMFEIEINIFLSDARNSNSFMFELFENFQSLLNKLVPSFTARIVLSSNFKIGALIINGAGTRLH